MESKQVWIVFTKSRPLDGCTIDVDGGEFLYAEVFVPFAGIASDGGSISRIVDDAAQALAEARIALHEISKCLCYHPDEWQERTDMNANIHENSKNALEANSVIIGGFRSEEIEADCRYLHTAFELDD